MLRLAIVFLVIALIAGVLGFGGIEHYSWEGAKPTGFGSIRTAKNS